MTSIGIVVIGCTRPLWRSSSSRSNFQKPLIAVPVTMISPLIGSATMTSVCVYVTTSPWLVNVDVAISGFVEFGTIAS